MAAMVPFAALRVTCYYYYYRNFAKEIRCD